MPLLLTEADVKALLTMPLTLEAVETSFQRLADGTAKLQYRQRLHVPGKGVLNHMAAADTTTGYMGLKIYSISREGARFLVTLFQAGSGELVSLIEADYLGQMRTGAASGVATRFMAHQDASVAAIIGTGLQAHTQLEAIAPVRKLESIRAFGRDLGRREAFARR
jgi:alanine dehydrogenase